MHTHNVIYIYIYILPSRFLVNIAVSIYFVNEELRTLHSQIGYMRYNQRSIHWNTCDPGHVFKRPNQKSHDFCTNTTTKCGINCGRIQQYGHAHDLQNSQNNKTSATYCNHHIQTVILSHSSISDGKRLLDDSAKWKQNTTKCSKRQFWYFILRENMLFTIFGSIQQKDMCLTCLSLILAQWRRRLWNDSERKANGYLLDLYLLTPHESMLKLFTFLFL